MTTNITSQLKENIRRLYLYKDPANDEESDYYWAAFDFIKSTTEKCLACTDNSLGLSDTTLSRLRHLIDVINDNEYETDSEYCSMPDTVFITETALFKVASILKKNLK